ncbi:MAG: hypothetical protein ACLQJ0_21795 [Steroidobacteraceae bacterium]|jgi:hypothetical protein
MIWIVIIIGVVIAFLAGSFYQSGALSQGPGALITIVGMVVFDLAIYLAERVAQTTGPARGGAR